MNIAEYSIKNKVISWTFVVLLLVGGSLSFTRLGQLEFPEFTLKYAMIITHYPGASPEQVEEEVTLLLEEQIQQMAQLKDINSVSSAGRSQIMVEMKDAYDAERLPQVWDELRRKVTDASRYLPPGVGQPIVVDDFSDVYGFLVNVTGEGYSYRELENYTKVLKRELILLDGVKKVSVQGVPSEQIIVEVDHAKLVALGVNPQLLYQAINSQNTISNAGSVNIDGMRFRINTDADTSSLNAIGNIVISAPGASEVVYVADVANIEYALDDTPSVLYHSNGAPALSLGVSFASGVNVVDISHHIRELITEQNNKMPLGMQITKVYDQGEVVDVAVADFLTSLALSILIVVIVLLVFMGVQSGILIGAVLMLTIFGTFIAMDLLDIQLQIISLGGLIIALGMLVDNAIVVTEGILVGLQRGLTRLEAAKAIVKQTQWPLLGATLIAIIAFAPIGLSTDSTGEFAGSLFWVLMISLFISWVTALTITPLFCHLLLKDGVATGEHDDPYKGVVFTVYRVFLTAAIRHRFITILVVFALLGAAVVGMGKVKNSFFPPSNTPIFFVDVWMPEGSSIGLTDAYISRVEDYIKQQNEQYQLGLKNITTVIGQGGQRFVLPYSPEKSYEGYAQLIIEADSLEALNSSLPQVIGGVRGQFSSALFRFRRLQNGPTPAASIEARVYGSDPVVMRKLATEIEAIMLAEPTAENVRHSWRNATMMLRPNINYTVAREVGVTRQAIDSAFLYSTDGVITGVYRDKTRQIPIVARAPDQERFDPDRLMQMSVWSDENRTFVPIGQMMDDIKVQWEDPLIMRRDRKRVLTIMADPLLLSDQTADSVFRKIKVKVDQLPLPDGYELEWGGEYESSQEAKSSLFSSLPAGYLAMFLITIVLFNSIRQPLVIWFTVPLSIIGVASGLLSLNAPLSFVALLGVLSLSGMLIKNGIVLVDQINYELALGKRPYQAIVDSSVSRVRPVSMAAITTMLGMVPLVFDAFFVSMAVTIIFGLGFATLLTLIILPVTYTILFAVKPE